MASESNGRAVLVVGRIVWAQGDLFKGKADVIFGSQQPKLKPNGEQSVSYGFGLAVKKEDATPLFQVMQEEAKSVFPSGQYPPDFAWKYKDGDSSVDKNGQLYSQREGYAGHYVFSCTTTLPIKWYRKNEQGAMEVINQGIKVGDYVWAQVIVKAHPAIGQGKSGLYLNPGAVMFLGFGKEIINTPSGETIFGAAQMPSMPAGASAQPFAPQGVAFPGGGIPVPPGQVGNMPSVPQVPQPQPTPHHAVLPQQFHPQQAPAMPPQPGQPMPPPVPGFAQSQAPYGGPPFPRV